VADGEGLRRRSGSAARDEVRGRRSRAILATALDILTTRGDEALTMQGIADALECGVATIYRLFPSKDALIAELQLDALGVLRGSWERGLEHLDSTMDDAGLDAGTQALARALAAGWFWVVAEERFPHEVDMSRRVVVDRATVVPEEQAARILASCLELFDGGRSCIEEAAAAGALASGDAGERAVVMVSTILGVAVTGRSSRWDLEVRDRGRIARDAVAGHLVAWGAERPAVDSVAAVLTAELEAGWLAPR
jgi:AcrR family transcriptional regulator